MTQATSDIAALLGSRICHDLISPIGAISNGVELLAMSGAGPMPEIDLIAQSVEHANARIGFFRVAFGAAAPDQVLGAAEIRQILADLTRGGRLEMLWSAEGEVARPEVKLVFLLLNCLENAMPWGGTIEVGREGARWHVAARAEKMRADPALWEGLSRSGPATGASAAEVQFLLAPLVAAELGRPLAVELSETGATIRA
ncbi:histidine phosphotransferase family protein [Psychromarinibacter sp. C21-152]|uniref:Histidine phosphotransferase family protein n=1 Tax=Psychromarinibacter sediminicola TaxID=3033385 RepID=A0AAE3NRZ6_9RHOB|nr:histidine phosphotransferase family protein [Psychromarinibacter sediminicola]MDF0600539.1 histidine phosphotransferase family protein [Psychromarinibacter sediminicola]